MPWSDLSDVTGALMRPLELNIKHVLGPGSGVKVVPTPPDRLGRDVSNTLSLYLYQVRPSPALRNLPRPAASAPLAAPIALDLFYMLTAHRRSANMFDALIEQRWIGHALRIFHDYPLFADDTRIAAEWSWPAVSADGATR